MKNELEKEKIIKASLNSGPLNLSEDNMNSFAELRMNALTLELPKQHCIESTQVFRETTTLVINNISVVEKTTDECLINSKE